MKRLAIIALSLMFILCLSLPGAEAFDGGDAVWAKHPIKWLQRPDEATGVNLRSTTTLPNEPQPGPIVADDWKCSDPRPVIDVHFWGCYIGWGETSIEPPTEKPVVKGFEIRIYKDVPADPTGANPYSHPGEEIYYKVVTVFHEVLWGSFNLPDNTIEHKFFYSLDLPVPFEQIEGTIYWISIAAIMPEGYKYPWGWETSIDNWNDNACFYNSIVQKWIEITPYHPYLPDWYRGYHKSVDMAFALSVPTPPPPELVKWQQRPDMNQGVNILSNPQKRTVADDWLCLDGSPVSDLHFWGSYIDWMENQPKPLTPPPGVKAFRIQVYSDFPAAGADGFSRPDKLLYEVWVDKFTETYVASIPLPWWIEQYEHKYRYDVQLPRIFWQKRDKIYWLNISAIPNHIEAGSKWLQRPDMKCGVNIRSADFEPFGLEPMIADDWQCRDLRPVKDVHFWGSYIGWERGNPVPPATVPDTVNVDSFIIRIYSDKPAAPGIPFSRPDVKIYEEVIKRQDFQEKYVASIPLPDGTYEHKFAYHLDLPASFHQEYGTIYWISIAARYDTTGIPPFPWGWETCDPADHYNDNACIFWFNNNYWDVILPGGWPMPEWYQGKCYPDIRTVDMAFELTVGECEWDWGWESSMDRWNDFAVRGWYFNPANWWWEMVYNPWTEKLLDMSFEITTCEGPIKWLQFPDMADGINILSRPMDPVVADDWVCTDGKPITEVHFWGSYISCYGPADTGEVINPLHWEQGNPGPPDSPLPPTPGVKSFKVSFHQDVPDGADPSPNITYSHPGALIREDEYSFSEVKERYWDSVPHEVPGAPTWWEHKFYYIIKLREPFQQEKGTVYWLDIGATPMSDQLWCWGWETSKDHWNDSATQGWEGGWYWENLEYLYQRRIDMAFLLITKSDIKYCEGDFDRDGDVDIFDLGMFAADFGRTNCYNTGNCEGDFDYDGDVDIFDLGIFAADFGRTNCPCKMPLIAP